MSWPTIIIAAVAFQRIAELILFGPQRQSPQGARRGRDWRRPLSGPGCRACRLVLAMWGSMDPDTAIQPVWFAIFLLLQLGRAWVLITLGGYWTTRLFHLEGVPLVQRGPYRLLRHPNYLIVAGEIATLPLSFGLWPTAVIFSLLNGAVLFWRMRIENRSLDRRAPENPVSTFPSR